MEPTMFSVDNYLIELVRYNGLTIAAAIGFLKVLARDSENTTDDKIITYLGSVFASFKKGE